MLPRRCKKCRCYVAPQLQRCPRCNKVAPSIIVVKPTKEDKQAALAKKDLRVPTLHAKNMHWIPSAFALRAHSNMMEELKRRLDKADTARLRNMVRSEIRCVKATLAKAIVPKGKKAWTSEAFHTKQQCIIVFVSPKKHRYVLADKDVAADLIIINRKRAATPLTRLQRFEKSRYARMKKAEKQEAIVHKKRHGVKKKARAEKRKRKHDHTSMTRVS